MQIFRYMCLGLLLFLVPGCGGGGLQNAYVSQSLSVNTSSQTAQAGQTLNVTVQLKTVSGTPISVAGTAVSLTSSDPSIIQSTSGTLDSAGTAVFTLTAFPSLTTSKTVTLTAKAGSYTSDPISILVQTAPLAGSLVLSYDTQSVTAGQFCTANIQFTPGDTTKTGIPLEGLQVTLTSDNINVVPNYTGKLANDGNAKIVIQPNAALAASATVHLIASITNNGVLLQSTAMPLVVTTPSLAGTVTLQLDRTSVGSGENLVATVNFTPAGEAGSLPLAGLAATITTSNPNVIATTVGSLDSTGAATILVATKPGQQSSTSVNLIATVNNVSSPAANVTVTSPTLILTPPANMAFTHTAPYGTILSELLPNLIVDVKDSAGTPVPNLPVTVSVTAIGGWAIGDTAVMYSGGFSYVAAPLASAVTATDSNGTVIMPTLAQMVHPDKDTSRSIMIQWKATATVDGIGMSAVGTTMVTDTGN